MVWSWQATSSSDGTDCPFLSRCFLEDDCFWLELCNPFVCQPLVKDPVCFFEIGHVVETSTDKPHSTSLPFPVHKEFDNIIGAVVEILFECSSLKYGQENI